MPRTLTLNGIWRFMLDLRCAGERERWYAPTSSDRDWLKVPVPAAWETYAREFRGYEGAAWFRRSFNVSRRTRIARLRFDGAGHRSTVWLNGRKIGTHDGAYVPFTIDAAPALKAGRNVLAVHIEHLFNDKTIPIINTDWWKYGGISRSVSLVTTNDAIIDRVTVLVSGDPAHPVITIPGRIRTPSGSSRGLTVTASVAGRRASVSGGGDSFSLRIDGTGLPLWSPAHPRLLNMEVSLKSKTGAVLDRRTIRFGVRTISWDHGRLCLNGRPLWLRGVNQVEEYPGWTCSPGRKAMRDRLLDIKRNLHGNYFRAAHYPHHPLLPSLADELGVMLPEEIPLCYHREYADTTARGKVMLDELFWRDAHHPSVIMWSTGNERPADRDDVARGIARLIRHVKSLDHSRPVTCVSNRGQSDRSLYAHDVLVLNEYFGVWGGTCPTTTRGLEKSARELSRELDIIHRRYPKKPMIIGEFGAPAFPLPGNKFGGEAWQAEFMRKTLKVFASKKYLSGCIAWCYIDQLIGSYRTYPVGYLGSNLLEVFGLRAFNGRKRPAYRVVADFFRKMARSG